MTGYLSITDLYDQSHRAFAAHLEEGLRLNPKAEPSHICWRTKNLEDFEHLCFLAKEMGDVFERDHNGHPLIWIMLEWNITHVVGDKTYRLQALEITYPREQDKSTHAAMLVFADAGMDKDTAIKEPAPSEPAFLLRFQRRNALDIIIG